MSKENIWLTNFPHIRINRYQAGYVVEIEKRKWYGRRYWTHIISVSGIPDRPWIYQSYDVARDELLKYLKWQLIHQRD